MKQYWLVRIDFLDHCAAEDEAAKLVRCVVWGLLYKETKNQYRLCRWAADKKVRSNNCDTLAIGKGMVKKIELIRKEVL